jgi:hypothetical protein
LTEEEDTVNYKSAEEVEREHLRAFGEDLGAVFHALFSEVVWLQDKWREYCTLFTDSVLRVDLLNESAGRFFGQLQAVLWEDVLMQISRLTDRSEMGKRENLSIQQFVRLCERTEFAARITSAVQQAADAAAFARDWRNRYIAHRDLPLALNRDAPGLAHASQKAVTDAVDAISAVIKLLHQEYLKFDVDLEVAGGLGDAEDLLRVLDDGVRAGRAREERFRAGMLLPEDREGPRAL